MTNKSWVLAVFFSLVSFAASAEGDALKNTSSTVMPESTGVRELGVVKEEDVDKAKNAQAIPPDGTWINHKEWKIGYRAPEGFKENGKERTTINFIGPTVGGSILNFTIVHTPIPGVAKEILYQANAAKFQDPTQYQNFKEVTTLAGSVAFQAEELDKETPSEMHRRYLMIFAPDRQYNVVFAGSMSGIRSSKDLIDQFFGSIEIEP